MKATKHVIARLSLIAAGAVALAATGCSTSHVHTTRTTYIPAPPVVVAPTPVVVAPPPPPAPVLMINSVTDFYEPLSAYGRWEMVASYGRVWIPGRIEVGWQPYANGYWQWTDAGWFWASDEPWGWATYHYGRWDWHPQYGWIWLPQTHWAPAWVAWREGGGYVGWAPLRPSVTVGVRLTSVNYETAFATRAFVFVEHRRMLEPVRPKTVVVNNTTIINRTVNITNLKVVNQTVINEGPRVDLIERESGRKLNVKPANQFRQREEAEFVARNRPSPAKQPVIRSEPKPTPVIPSREIRAAPETPRPAMHPPQPAGPVRRTAPPAAERQPVPVTSQPKVQAVPTAREPARTIEHKPTPPPVANTPPRPPTQVTTKPVEISKPAPPPTNAKPARQEARGTPAREVTPTVTPAPANRPVAPRVVATPPPQEGSTKEKARTVEKTNGNTSKPAEKNESKSRNERENPAARDPGRTQPR